MDYGTGFPNVVVAAVACHVQTKTCEDSQQPKGIESTINLQYTCHSDKVSRNFLFLFPHGFDAEANLLESLLKVVVGAFAWVVDNRDGLLRHGSFNFLHALDEADVALDFLLAVGAVHLRGCRYLKGVGCGSLLGSGSHRCDGHGHH